jgi:uncharacterized protein (TIGR03437 family)
VSIAVDGAGSLYIADTNNHRIRKVTNGTISTLAGAGVPGNMDGIGTKAIFSFPKGIAVDARGNIFVADPGNNLIRKVDSNAVVTTIAGNGALAFAGDGGAGKSASFGGASYLAINAAGDIYIADTANGRVRVLSAASNTIATIAGNGLYRHSNDGVMAINSFLSDPQDAKIGPDGLLYVVDSQNHRILRVNRDNTITTVAGNGKYGYSGDGVAATATSLYYPRQMAFDSAGNFYIADSINLRIRKVTPQGIISTVAGNGRAGYSGDNQPATSATLNYPTGVAVDSSGALYIADQLNNVIRKVSGGTITTYAGTGKFAYSGDNVTATTATFSQPERLYMDSANTLWVADIYSHRVRKITKDGIVHLVAGTGDPGYFGDGGSALQAQLNSPAGVALDNAGNLFIADAGNNVIRMVSSVGTITTVAGSHVAGFSGDGGVATNATFNQPLSLIPDGSGGLHIADTLNNRIRHLLATTPSFKAAPTTLTFSAPAGGAVTTPQTIVLSSAVTGLAFSVSASDPWLNASLTGGNMPGSVDIAVDPSQLSPGTVNGTITITAPQAAVPLQQISVTANISGSQAPAISAGSAGVNFAFVQGAAPGSSTLTITNQGGGSIDFTVAASTSSGDSWLQISPPSGTVTPAVSASLTVTATPGTLAAGAYSGTITVTSAAGDVLQIPVNMAISPARSKILLSQEGLTFIAVSQGGSPLPQSIGILNVGSGVMSWTAQATTLSGSGWLSLSSTSGTVNQPYLDVSFANVTVNAQALAPGVYHGQIQVSASGGDNSPQTVLVALNVLPAGSNPGPEVGPTGMVFTGLAGGENPGSQKVMIANVTASPLAYGSSPTYVGGGSWLVHSPANATISPGNPAQIAVQPDFSNLPSAVRRAALTFAFDDGSIRSVSILSVVAPAGSASGSSVSSPARGIRQASSATGCQPTKLLPIFTSIGPGPSVPASFPVALQAHVVDDCANPLAAGGAVVATFSNGDPPRVMVGLGNGDWTGTWQPANPAPAGVTVSLSANLKSLNLTGSAQMKIGLVSNPPVPVLSGVPASAVSLASGPLAPGELMLIRGTNLADAQISSADKPQSQLAGASVLIGGRPASLLYADTSAVIGIVPSDVPINTQQQVLVQHGANLAVPTPVIVAAAQPALFTQDGSGQGQALAYHSSGGTATSLADTSSALNSGDTFVIYCAGLGPVDAAGNAIGPVSISLGGQPAIVSYAGAALQNSLPPEGPPAMLGGVAFSGLVGVYQITATVPGGLAGGQTAIAISSAGQTSQDGVTLWVSGP